MTSPERDEDPAVEGALESAERPDAARDLLAEACARAGLPSETLDALTAWLAQQLVADRSPRLEAAGHSVEGGIPLAQVFVDLDVSEFPDGESVEWDDNSHLFVEYLCSAARLRGRGQIEGPPQDPQAGRMELREAIEGYVLIGGPGQGKSTLGQLLCQLHRAGLLRPRVDHLTGHPAREAVDAFAGDDAGRALGRPAELLFPLRIPLAEAAAWLAGQEVAPPDEAAPALLRYLADRALRAGHALPAADLERLLRRCDWLLVLDGLDEVPGSSDRDRILEAARELLARLAPGPSRGLLVATTRPQGYAGELDGLGVATRLRYLVWLSQERALAYAKRLVAARFGDPPERREKVLSRLQQAAANEATARLMRSPLQVTILATLVDRIGRAPSERWTLFREYYRVIYEREMERPLEAAELLRLYRAHIDKVHAHVGLLLQVETERSGGTDSVLSPERFRQIVDATLAEDEIDGARREELVGKLEAAAQERLVLLVELRPGKLGFEVRSIQEFMAALALTQKGEAIVEARIAQVAGAASFRNVVLFLASKAFTELSDLRDAFTDRLCPRLNEEPEDAGAALAGSFLALEILEEGSALKQTRYVRKLVEMSARLLELPPSPLHGRLARACLADLDAASVAAPMLEQAIVDRLAMEVPEQRLGAWVTLLAFVNVDAPWARVLADARWEDGSKVRAELVDALAQAELPVGRWLFEKMLGALAEFPPHALESYVQRHRSKQEPLEGVLEALHRLCSRGDEIHLAVVGGEERTPLSLRLAPVLFKAPAPWAGLAAMPAAPPAWRLRVAAARLAQSPSASTLAEELKELAGVFDAELFRQVAKRLPWPLGACVGVASAPDELRSLAARAKAGQLGDTDDWRAAEARWQSHKIDIDSIVALTEEAWPFSAEISHQGIPLAAIDLWWLPGRRHDRVWLDTLRSAIARAAARPVRAVLLDWLMVTLHRLAEGSVVVEPPLSLDEVQRIWAESNNPFRIEILCPLQPWKHPDPRWAEFLDAIGRSQRFSVSQVDLGELPRFVATLYMDDPRRAGLLRILALMAVVGGKFELPRDRIDTALLHDDRTRDSADLVLLAQDSLSPAEAEVLAIRLVRPVEPHCFPASHLLRILEHLPKDSPVHERALLALSRNVPPDDWRLAARIAKAVAASASRHSSGLDDGIVWDRLHLPLPRPERHRPSGHPPSARPPAAERRPVAIDTITLQNVRTFDDFTISPAAPAEDVGQWTVVLGKNGTGKSTFLRSFVFTLVDVTSQPNRLPWSTFAAPWRRRGINGQGQSFAQVRVQGDSYRADFTLDPAREPEETLKQGSPPLPYPVFAYGCRRGSALGGVSRQVNDEPGAEVPTLFDEGADLIHAETWLLLRENAAQKNEPARRIYDTVLKALTGDPTGASSQTVPGLLPGVEKIEGRGDRVWVTGPAVGDVPLGALSDGYLTTVGWVIDLLARWIKRAELRKEPIPDDFIQTMTGLVLIDEIDLHLHPDWQRHVIADARRIFPRMSFIVTTHNPLTLLGARAEEIWELRRDDGGRIVARQGREQPVLMTGSDLYDSYFGIKRLFPDDLGEMLDRYGFLARSAIRTDEEEVELQQLLAALRARGVEPGWEPVAREELPPYPGDEGA